MSDPWFRFFPSDFLNGTCRLSPVERGVYITLLAVIYDSDGPIRRDDARLARQCGQAKGAFVKTLESLIELGKVTLREGLLSNPRAEIEIEERSGRCNRGKTGALSRWGKNEGKSTEPPCEGISDANTEPVLRARVSQPQSQLQDSSLRSESIEPSLRSGSRPIDAVRDPEDLLTSLDRNLPALTEKPIARTSLRSEKDLAGKIFDERFWPVYPRKDSKAKAREKFIAIVLKGTDPKRIIDGASQYADRRRGEDPQFTRMAATWLNNRNWEDDLSPPPGAARPATRGPANPFSGIMATIDFNNVGQRDAGHEYGSDPLAIEYRRD